jgi:hypothetical protein
VDCSAYGRTTQAKENPQNPKIQKAHPIRCPALSCYPTIHNLLFVSIKRDKHLPQIDLLSNTELEIIYYLQKPISDIKELSRKTNKSRSQINILLSSIAIKMDVPNNRAGLVVSTFRGLGEVRKTSVGTFALPSVLRY